MSGNIATQYMGILSIGVDQLVLHADLQARVGELREDVIDDYVRKFLEGREPPALRVMRVDDVNFVTNGNYRATAARRAGRPALLCEVHVGSWAAAVLAAAGANAENGVHRTQADRRRAVELLLRNPELCGMSSRGAGRAADVSHALVSNMRRQFGIEVGEVLTDARVAAVATARQDGPTLGGQIDDEIGQIDPLTVGGVAPPATGAVVPRNARCACGSASQQLWYWLPATAEANRPPVGQGATLVSTLSPECIWQQRVCLHCDGLKGDPKRIVALPPKAVIELDEDVTIASVSRTPTLPRSPITAPRPHDVVRLPFVGDALAICQGWSTNRQEVSVLSLFAGGERRFERVHIASWMEVTARGIVLQAGVENPNGSGWEPPAGGYDYGLPRNATNAKGWKHAPDEHYPPGHRASEPAPVPAQPRVNPLEAARAIAAAETADLQEAAWLAAAPEARAELRVADLLPAFRDGRWRAIVAPDGAATCPDPSCGHWVVPDQTGGRCALCRRVPDLVRREIRLQLAGSSRLLTHAGVGIRTGGVIIDADTVELVGRIATGLKNGELMGMLRHAPGDLSTRFLMWANRPDPELLVEAGDDELDEDLDDANEDDDTDTDDEDDDA